MARLDQLQNEQRQRQNRYFSDDFKRSKVKDIERNLVTITELSREYQVTRTSIYKWIYKYSSNRKRQERQIVERMSDTRKIKELQDRIKTILKVQVVQLNDLALILKELTAKEQILVVDGVLLVYQRSPAHRLLVAVQDEGVRRIQNR